MNAGDKRLMREIWGIPRHKLPAQTRRELPELERRLRKQVAQGDPAATSCLAYLVSTKAGQRSSPEVSRLLRRAAALGEPAAQLQLAWELEQRRPRAALGWLSRSARQGFAEAIFVLGVSLYRGNLGKKNLPEAIKLLKRAHRRGHAGAACWLGRAFDGLRRPDPKSALRWYRIAAEQGDLVGMHNLAVAYENGEGVRRNKPQAQKWFARARSHQR